MTEHQPTSPLSVCLFCGSSEGNDPLHQKTAEQLGRLWAANGVRLVYGGGGIGLMGIAARAAMAASGEVIGVLPQSLEKLDVGLTEITDLVIVDGMHARKKMMYDLSDAFVVLPGGVGTLDEAIEMITWAQLQHHAKPIIIVNGKGYWQKFIELLSHVIDEGFAPPHTAGLYTVIADVNDVLPAIRSLLQKS